MRGERNKLRAQFVDVTGSRVARRVEHHVDVRSRTLHDVVSLSKKESNSGLQERRNVRVTPAVSAAATSFAAASTRDERCAGCEQ